jgi:enterochelin esterase-like enzyme
MRDALVEMGFDPPRAILVADLLVTSAAAAAAGLAGGSRRLAALIGAAALPLLFRGTLASEVASDLRLDPTARFDPSGVASTVATLVVIGTAVGVGTGALACELRAVAGRLVDDSVRAVRAHAGRRRASVRMVTAVAALAALLAAVPALGDMLNYEPDTAIVAAGPAAASERPAAGPTPFAAIGSPLPSVAPPVLSSATPWVAWRPSGSGHVATMTMPAPWTGGSSQITVSVYTPPGYTTARRYPTVYVVPWSVNSWQRGARITASLDGSIDAGTIPPAVYVWASALGGPYTDSECTDSHDGRERYETFLTSTLIAAVDGRFSTIATPAGRTVMGMSQGGFCAAELLTRHPDVFGSAISFSGYYTAGIVSNQTVNAHLPFGGDAALIASHSPVLAVGRLATDVRRSILQVVVGDPREAFYGSQMQSYVAALHRAGVAVDEIVDPLGHSWACVRHDLATALREVAAWQVTVGVLS